MQAQLLHDGNLLNSPANVFIDSVLFVLIIASILPQVFRFCETRTWTGISSSYLLLNTLFASTHLALTIVRCLDSYPDANDTVVGKIHAGKLRGLAAYGGLLGLIQVAAYWCGSMVLLIAAYIRMANASNINHTVWNHLKPCIISFLAIICAIIPLYPVTETAVRGRRDGDVWLVGFMVVFGLPLNLLFLILQFVPQVFQIRASRGDPGSLSLRFLVARGVADLLLAVRWLQRVGLGNVQTASWWHRYWFMADAVDFFFEGKCMLGLALVYFRHRQRDGLHRVGESYEEQEVAR